MPEQFVEAFVDKLILLEQNTGVKIHYRLMPPTIVPFYDTISIQDAAKRIAHFIGLNNLTFIVTIAKQADKVGGNIDLSTSGNEVFIEIDNQTMQFPDAISATLCHEVCHKWLQYHGIASPIEIENEILTDITTVFLGLGKIMLNGSKVMNVRHEAIQNGTRTITETISTGYLKQDQLAFVYRLVCAMRNIPSSEYIQDLNADAIHAVRACDSAFQHYYDSRFHRLDTTQESVVELHKRIIAIQHDMAELNKHIAYVHKALCEFVNRFNKEGHGKLNSLRQKALLMTEEDQPDPVMRFLRSIKKEFELDRMNHELDSVKRDSIEYCQHAKAIGRYLYRKSKIFPLPSSEMFNMVICPRDGTKLRLPENSGDLIAICPVCKYNFAYNTTIISFPEPPAPPLPRNLTWIERIRQFFQKERTD